MTGPIGIDRHSLPNALRSLVANELDQDERLAWLDQPIPATFAKQYWPVMLFGIPFGGFAAFWIASAAWGVWGGENRPDGPFLLFPLFGIPFLLIGLGMLSSPLYGRWQARGTAYALTDRRAILFEKQWNGYSVRSFRPDQLGTIERIQYSDGAGNLIFDREVSNYSGEGGRQVKQIGFKGVRKVKQVEDLIEALVLKHRDA